LRYVLVDANVVVSFFYHRNESQRTAAKELLVRAENGELVVLLPQFVMFEMVHVFHNFYGVPARKVATVIRDMIAYPGVVVVDECPWKHVLDHWLEPLPSIADAAIVALAITNRYDAVATFDPKLAKQMKSLGVASYW
jgi:predicted nucleic acid-binding protein